MDTPFFDTTPICITKKMKQICVFFYDNFFDYFPADQDQFSVFVGIPEGSLQMLSLAQKFRRRRQLPPWKRVAEGVLLPEICW